MNIHEEQIYLSNPSNINEPGYLYQKRPNLQDFRLINQKLEALQKIVYSNKTSSFILYTLLAIFLLIFFLNHGPQSQIIPQIQTITSHSTKLQTQIINLKKIIQQMDQTLEYLFNDYKNKVYNIIQKNIKTYQMKEGTLKNMDKQQLQLIIQLQKLNRGISLVRQTDKREFNQLKINVTTKQYKYYDTKYKMDKIKQEQSICVIVPTWENAPDFRYERNLISILNQNYTNFKVHIAVDLSDDPTYYLLSRYLRKNNIHENKVTLLKRTQRSYMMKNVIQTARSHCKPNDIIVIVQGDDSLLGVNVFNVLNTLYTRNKLGFVYSNNLIYNNRDQEIVTGDSYAYQPETIQNQDYRKVFYRHSHLRSFRAELLFSIKQEDLRRGGQYLKVGIDNALLYPIEQMSCKKILFVNQIFYMINNQTGINQYEANNDEKIEMEKYIRQLPKYECHENYF